MADRAHFCRCCVFNKSSSHNLRYGSGPEVKATVCTTETKQLLITQVGVGILYSPAQGSIEGGTLLTVLATGNTTAAGGLTACRFGATISSAWVHSQPGVQSFACLVPPSRKAGPANLSISLDGSASWQLAGLFTYTAPAPSPRLSRARASAPAPALAPSGLASCPADGAVLTGHCQHNLLAPFAGFAAPTLSAYRNSSAPPQASAPGPAAWAAAQQPSAAPVAAGRAPALTLPAQQAATGTPQLCLLSASFLQPLGSSGVEVTATVLGNTSALATSSLLCGFGNSSVAAVAAAYQNTSAAVVQCSSPAGYLGAHFDLILQNGSSQLTLTSPFIPLNATWTLGQTSFAEGSTCLVKGKQQIKVIAGLMHGAPPMPVCLKAANSIPICFNTKALCVSGAALHSCGGLCLLKKLCMGAHDAMFLVSLCCSRHLLLSNGCVAVRYRPGHRKPVHCGGSRAVCQLHCAAPTQEWHLCQQACPAAPRPDPALSLELLNAAALSSGLHQ